MFIAQKCVTALTAPTGSVPAFTATSCVTKSQSVTVSVCMSETDSVASSEMRHLLCCYLGSLDVVTVYVRSVTLWTPKSLKAVVPEQHDVCDRQSIFKVK